MEDQQIILEDLKRRYPALEECLPALEELINSVTASYRQGGTFFAAGPGGSAADADPICGELLKGFRSRRALAPEEKEAFKALFGAEGEKIAEELQGGLPAVSLVSHAF